MTQQHPTAHRDSWQHRPMPRRRARLCFSRTFNKAEFARMAQGLVPQEMEDKWFIFLDGTWLSFHRSWTGICIYRVRIEPRRDDFEATAAWVNRDQRQYTGSDLASDTAILAFLIDRLLLGREPVFPNVPGIPAESQPLARFSLVGDARAADEPLPERWRLVSRAPPEDGKPNTPASG